MFANVNAVGERCFDPLTMTRVHCYTGEQKQNKTKIKRGVFDVVFRSYAVQNEKRSEKRYYENRRKVRSRNLRWVRKE